MSVRKGRTRHTTPKTMTMAPTRTSTMDAMAVTVAMALTWVRILGMEVVSLECGEE